MENDARALIAENPDWRALLTAYSAEERAAAEKLAEERAAARATASKKSAADAVGSDTEAVALPATELADASLADEPANSEAGDDDGGSKQRQQIWVRRLPHVSGIPVEELPQIHGLLIAEGLLQFSLGGRDEGVLYRLTREARSAISNAPTTELSGSDEEALEAA